MPRVNWGLMLAVMTLVVGFQSSGDLAAAYGIAVTGDMVITTLLAGIVFHYLWGWSKARTITLVTLFLIVDLAFFSANILKSRWRMGASGHRNLIFTLMLTWKTGRSELYAHLKSEAMALQPFIEAMGAHPATRVPGNAIFMTPDPDGVPHAMLHNLKHNKVLHEKVVILTVKFLDIPYAPPESRVELEKLEHEFYRVSVSYGFKDEPDLPRDLAQCAGMGLSLEPMDTSYFIGKESLIANNKTGMAMWRKKIFIGLFRSAETITNQFKLPANRVVELGAQVSF